MAPELLMDDRTATGSLEGLADAGAGMMMVGGGAGALGGPPEGVLGEFGAAAAAQAPSADKLKAGLKAGSSVGYAIDVYSFGVCLWEMCVRTYPWHDLLEAGAVDELKRRVGVLAQRPEVPSGTPPAYRALLEACWRQEPSERPTFAQLATLDFSVLGHGGPAAVRHVLSLVGEDDQLPERMHVPPSLLTACGAGGAGGSLGSYGPPPPSPSMNPSAANLVAAPSIDDVAAIDQPSTPPQAHSPASDVLGRSPGDLLARSPGEHIDHMVGR